MLQGSTASIKTGVVLSNNAWLSLNESSDASGEGGATIFSGNFRTPDLA